MVQTVSASDRLNIESIPRHDRCYYEVGATIMTMNRTVNRSVSMFAALFAVWTASGSSLGAQKPEVQRLFQSGSYEQAVEAARDGDPASTYLAAQSLLKLDRAD